jgi:DNA-binding response OmpR family regulator
MPKILIADDDADIRRLLAILLTGVGHQVIEAENGRKAAEVCNDDIDLAILDVMMPVMDGCKACEEIRKKSKVPILFLSAKGQEYDKIVGFSAGGDDYLVKPFAPSELQARVKAMLRRYFEYGGERGTGTNHIFQTGSLTINEDSCKVTVDGNEKTLTSTEYRILLLLCKTKGKVFSAKNIYESIWEEPYFHTSNNTVMVHIRKLREKIETDPQNPKYIKTIWGMGYKIET